jgi:hypothetical protein
MGFEFRVWGCELPVASSGPMFQVSGFCVLCFGFESRVAGFKLFLGWRRAAEVRYGLVSRLNVLAFLAADPGAVKGRCRPTYSERINLCER